MKIGRDGWIEVTAHPVDHNEKLFPFLLVEYINPTTTFGPIPLIFSCDEKDMKDDFSTDTISPVQGPFVHQTPSKAEQPQAES